MRAISCISSKVSAINVPLKSLHSILFVNIYCLQTRYIFISPHVKGQSNSRPQIMDFDARMNDYLHGIGENVT